MTFSLKQGYCFLLIDDDWGAAPDDDWDIVIAPCYLFNGTPPEYVGERVIDGSPCVVFRSPGGFWAQTTVVARD